MVPKPNELAAQPTLSQRLARWIVGRFLSRAERGCLSLTWPDGKICRFGPEGEPRASMRVASWELFLRLLWDGDIGLGDGLVAGEWDSPDLTAVVSFFIANRASLDDRRLFFTRWLGRGRGWLRQLRRSNTLEGSWRNIQAHYDLGNQLYGSFLGETMAYSCADFANPEHDLEQVQLAKMDGLLEPLRLTPECHLLEVGCGWGSLSIRAARRFGCQVTGITLSQAQAEWARRQVSEAGLSHLVEIRLCDYRELEGRYDRAISCEMLEAVGHENFREYFSVLERVLVEEALLMIQVITVPDFSYQDYRRNQDWIQKEIFPGALCPSLSALLQAASQKSRWVLEELRNIGPHYATTLREWRSRFEGAWPKLKNLGYDERFRLSWNYYLCYCEAAFATRNLATVQMLLTRPQNRLLLKERVSPGGEGRP